MKGKKQLDPPNLGFTIVFVIIWQIWLIIRFIYDDTRSPLYLIHVVLAIILDICIVRHLILLRKAKKNHTLSEDSEKWNRMWELWVMGEMESPYAELMTYYSEVCNGGHGQYFENVKNNGDLQKEMAELEKILPPEFRENLKKAYDTYVDDSTDGSMERCDTMFFENEEVITQIMAACAEKTNL